MVLLALLGGGDRSSGDRSGELVGGRLFCCDPLLFEDLVFIASRK